MSDSRTVTAIQARKSLLKAFEVKRPYSCGVLRALAKVNW